jgi:VanZ family protein
VVNLALYVPLGMSGYLALRSAGTADSGTGRAGNTQRGWNVRVFLKKFRVIGPVALGMLLSAAIEMLQLYVPGRNCSALDLLNNTIGSALGVAAGMLFVRIAAGRSFGLKRPPRTDRTALALLFCWVASLLFPFFPVTSLPLYREELLRFTGSPLLQPITLLSDAACWFVAGKLIEATGLKPVTTWLGMSLFLIPAQFFIVNRQPLPADFIGAMLGVVLFSAVGAKPATARFAAACFLLLLLIRGLTPFRLTAVPHPFNWQPFGAFLAMQWQSGLRVLLEKVFYYAAPIWLLRQTGLRLRTSVLIVAALLAFIESVQIYLPGRTPEITDPLLALLIGFGFRAWPRSSKLNT